MILRLAIPFECNLLNYSIFSFPCVPIDESKLKNIFYGATRKLNDLKMFKSYFEDVLKEFNLF